MSNQEQVVAGEGRLTITREMFGQEQEEQRIVRVQPFLEGATPGFVTVKLGRTINLGNYSSARVDVGFTVPGYREELPQLYQETMEAVSKIMKEEVASIESACGIRAQRIDRSVDEML